MNVIPIINADEEGKKILKSEKEQIFRFINISMENDYLKQLRDILPNEPDIFNRYNQWMYNHLPHRIISLLGDYEDVIVDAALIFEWEIQEYFDRVVLIDGGSIDERMRRKQVKESNIFYFLEKQQLSVLEKKRKSDIIINNSGTIEELRENAEKLYKDLFHTHSNINKH